MKSSYMSVVDFGFRNRALRTFWAMLTTCRTGLLLNHIILIEIYLLKTISSGGMMDLNLNGGNETV